MPQKKKKNIHGSDNEDLQNDLASYKHFYMTFIQSFILFIHMRHGFHATFHYRSDK